MSTSNLELPSQGLSPDLDSSSWNLLVNDSRYETEKDIPNENFQSPSTSAIISPYLGSAQNIMLRRKETPTFNLDQTSPPTGKWKQFLIMTKF